MSLRQPNLPAASDLKKDTSNGTSIYNLGTTIGPTSQSSIISENNTVSVSRNHSSGHLIEATSHAFIQGTPSSTTTTTNATNGIAPYESTSSISYVVFAPVTTKISILNSTNTKSTGSRSAAITSTPRSNATTTPIPDGMGTLGNATFKTSCDYTDVACYSTCSSSFDSCSNSWEQYSALYQTWLSSMSAEGLVSASLTSRTTYSYIYTLTSYLAVSIEH